MKRGAKIICLAAALFFFTASAAPDNTPPAAELLMPAAGKTESATPPIKIRLADQSGIAYASLQVLLNGQDLTPYLDLTSTGVSGKVPGSMPLSPGENQITVRVRDKKGNRAEQRFSVYFLQPSTGGPALTSASVSSAGDTVILRNGSQLIGSVRAITPDQVALEDRTLRRAEVLQINFAGSAAGILSSSDLDQVLLRSNEIRSGMVEFADRSEVFLSGVPIKRSDIRAMRFADKPAEQPPIHAGEPPPPPPLPPPPPPPPPEPPKRPEKEPGPPKPPDKKPPEPRPQDRCPEVPDKKIPPEYVGLWMGVSAYGQMDFTGRQGAGQAKVDMGHRALRYSFYIKPGGEVEGEGIAAYHMNVSGGSALGPMPMPIGASASLEGGVQEVSFKITGRACADGKIRLKAVNLPYLRLVYSNGQTQNTGAWNVFPSNPQITIPPRDARIAKTGRGVMVKHEVIVSFAKATGNPKDGRVMRMGWEAKKIPSECDDYLARIENLQVKLDLLNNQVKDQGKRTGEAWDRLREAAQEAAKYQGDFERFRDICKWEQRVVAAVTFAVKRAAGLPFWADPTNPEKAAKLRDMIQNLIDGQTSATVRRQIESCLGTLASASVPKEMIDNAYFYSQALDEMAKLNESLQKELNNLEHKLTEKEMLEKQIEELRRQLEDCLKKF